MGEGGRAEPRRKPCHPPPGRVAAFAVANGDPNKYQIPPLPYHVYWTGATGSASAQLTKYYSQFGPCKTNQDTHSVGLDHRQGRGQREVQDPQPQRAVSSILTNMAPEPRRSEPPPELSHQGLKGIVHPNYKIAYYI
jgi:hypothetical protein